MKQYKQPYINVLVITTGDVISTSTTDPAGFDNENWFIDLEGDLT